MIPLSEAAEIIADLRAQTGHFWDADVLGDLIQPCDHGQEWVSSDNNYSWWAAIGSYFRLNCVAEIGTRYGYSLRALTKSVVSPDRLTLHVWDAEVDADKEPLKVFEAYFRCAGFRDIHITRADTQKLDRLDICGRLPDMCVQDADHSEAGCLHDMKLLAAILRPGGILVVDDAQPGSVADAVKRFVEETGADYAYLPTFRGVALVRP